MNSSRPNKLKLAALALLAIALIAAVLVFVVNPLMQTPVDPNAKGPQISKSTETDDNKTRMRGSMTDVLFQPAESPAEHPLDLALEVARKGLEKINTEVCDYTALMVKQERIKGNLLPEEFMRVKVRHASEANDVNTSFYCRHVKPGGMAGQEAIWVDGRNNGKLVAHGAGWQKLITVNLAPNGRVARRNNRYPITEMGIKVLIQRMIEKGDRDRQHDDDCTVDVSRDFELDGHPCTVITITHPEEKSPFEFHAAKIYIDDQLDLPIGYEGFMWPEEPGGEPVLVERYFYRELKINVGLTDADFDPKNPDYEF